MPDVPEPVSCANMDANFEKRIRDLRQAAADEYVARAAGNQVEWFRPAGWNGDVFDVEGMALPFARHQANDDYVKAVQSAAAPGTTGDVVATTTMIDTLACMERAYRVRHSAKRIRGVAQMLARKRGHGHARGPLEQCYLEYLRVLLEESKS